MTDVQQRNRWDGIRRLGRLTLKELREILRDRRTIVTLVLMPLLLYPLLSIAFQQFFLSTLGKIQQPRYILAFRSTAEAKSIVQYLRHGGLKLDDPEKAAAPPTTESLTTPVVVAELVPNFENEVREFKIDVGISVVSGSVPQFDSQRDLALDLEFLYNDQSLTSKDALAYVEKHLAIANEKFLRERLANLGVSQRPVPVRAAPKACTEVRSGGGNISIEAVIPFILVLMTITGAVYPAIDLTAGERERGTLEVLVAAPFPRVGLLFAKYIAVVSVALLTASANLVTMTITVMVSGVGRLLFGSGGLSLTAVAAVFGLLVLFAAFFSAVLLVLTSFARSFKKAQAYLIPLMLVSLAPGVMSLTPDLELAGILMFTPLVNIVLLGRDLFQSHASPFAASVVVASTVLYAFAAIACAARIFGSESVLYSSHMGWSGFFSRPAQPQPAPSITAAMLCLALLFPAYFLLSHSIAHFGGGSLLHRLVLSGLTTALLFGVFPLVATLWERVPFVEACRIRPAGVIGLTAALLLGLSLWTLAHEIVVATTVLGLVTLDDAVVERLLTFVGSIRRLHPAAVVIALAVIPAVFEELFFRGYLYSALRPITNARTTILGSAVLFGLFHLVATDSLAVERFLPSTFLGAILAWIRWRTGSVLPGMLLHASHNGLLLLVAYYEPQLSALGVGITKTDVHLPATWFLAGGLAALTGALLIQFGCRPEERTEAAGGHGEESV